MNAIVPNNGHVPSALGVPGDKIICDGVYTEVIAVHTFQPGTHASSPIHNDCIARLVVTVRGSRWAGHAVGGRYVGVEVTTHAPYGVSFNADGSLTIHGNTRDSDAD